MFVISSVCEPAESTEETKYVTFGTNVPGLTIGAVYVPTMVPSIEYVVVGMPCTSIEPRGPTTATSVPVRIEAA